MTEFIRFAGGGMVALVGASIVNTTDPATTIGTLLLVIGVASAFSTM